MSTVVARTGTSSRTRYVGFFLLALAAFTAVVLGLDSEGNATFRLSNPRDEVSIGPLIIPALPFIQVAAAIIAFFGVRLLRQGNQSAARIRTNLWLGLAILLFVMAFLTWATAGKTLSLMGLLQSTVVRAVPIAFGGLAGVLSERVAVINIAIEGMLLAGAFAGAVIGSVAGG
ncbi:MAG: ABC transporter permease, partial [Pseudomonadota bacterium]